MKLNGLEDILIRELYPIRPDRKWYSGYWKNSGGVIKSISVGLGKRLAGKSF